MFLKSVQVDQYLSKVISKCTYKFTCTCGSSFIEKTERRASTKFYIVPLFQKNILLNYIFLELKPILRSLVPKIIMDSVVRYIVHLYMIYGNVMRIPVLEYAVNRVYMANVFSQGKSCHFLL